MGVAATVSRRRGRIAHGPLEPSARKPSWDRRLALGTFWLLLLGPAFVYWPAAREAFRLPKLMLAECLALAALVLLALGLRHVSRVRLGEIVALPVVRVVLPVALVATATLATTSHTVQVRSALADLWVGLGCLLGLTLGLSATRLRRYLDGLMAASVPIALIGVAQYFGLWRPRLLLEVEEIRRLGVVSSAGNAGDLAAFLVLPALVAQQALWAQRPRRWLWGLALCVVLCGIAATQSLTALVALAAGSGVLWLSLPWQGRRLLPWALVAAALLGGALVTVLTPAEHRLTRKLEQLRGVEVNQLLSGRLDGWRAALRMVGENPWTGVGHGAYRAEFGRARIALAGEGVSFLQDHPSPFFANAHNDYLEAVAEWGLPGAVVLAWGLLAVGFAALRIGRGGAVGGRQPRAAAGDRALALAGLAALALLALAFFPFRVAMVAYPGLFFLAWVFGRSAEEGQA